MDEDQQDQRFLPIANVGRIMKQILPANAKISKESKQTMQECSTEFISFVTAEASDKCRKENRKTVNGDDICWALNTLGFDNYSEAMVRYLYKYRAADQRQKPNQNVKAGSSTPPDQDHKQIEQSNYGSNEQLGNQSNEDRSPNSVGVN